MEHRIRTIRAADGTELEKEASASLETEGPKKYFETLSDSDRETLFAFMRTIDAEAMRLETEHRRLSPGHGEIGVGAAAFDPWIKSYATLEYLGALRTGQDPDDARDSAQVEARYAVSLHNKKRPKDIAWQRWTGTADNVVENLHRRTPLPEGGP